MVPVALPAPSKEARILLPLNIPSAKSYDRVLSSAICSVAAEVVSVSSYQPSVRLQGERTSILKPVTERPSPPTSKQMLLPSCAVMPQYLPVPVSDGGGGGGGGGAGAGAGSGGGAGFAAGG